jgi:hypothetical protein
MFYSAVNVVFINQVAADPVSDFYLMRIADPDPGYQNDADPNPQHCLYLHSPPLLPPHTLYRAAQSSLGSECVTLGTLAPMVLRRK